MGKFVISQAKNGVKFNLKAAMVKSLPAPRFIRMRSTVERVLPVLSTMLLLLR